MKGALFAVRCSLFALLGGCLEPVRTETSCSSCHGSEASAAPPTALGGSSDPTHIGVGQHAAHADVDCAECHVVPGRVDAEGHIDAWPAEVAWGTLAKTDGAFEGWSHDDPTCAVYCHGAGLSGGTATDLSWVEEATLDCGSCHGSPPPDPHPQEAACDTCHPVVPGDTHIDGVVQASGEACAGCHGDDSTLAPPPDTSGNTDTTVVTVGAHRAHVEGGQVSLPVPCTTCHVVPAAVGDAGHIDGAPAEVVFSGIAVARGADPEWDRSTCADTYCHTAALTGGSITEPSWTVVDGSQSACGTCHAMPPPSPHPSSSNCSGCHDTAGPGQTIARPNQHVDGTVDL